MSKKVEVVYTKYYSKSVTKEVDVPDEVADVDAPKWIRENELELFEEEITAASLNLDDSTVEITCGIESDNSDEIIERINEIIKQYGQFTVADVEADHSPFVAGRDNLSHLMEDFTTDGGRVYIYDPLNRSTDYIDKYDADFEDLDEAQLGYVLKLAEKWEEMNE